MNYNQFIEKLKFHKIDIVDELPGVPRFFFNRKEEKEHKNEKKNNPKHYIYVRWMYGGVGGGSCWNTDGEDRRYLIEGNPPEELTSLDSVLEKICPSITFLVYKKLTNAVVKHGSYTENDYYGNETSYRYRYVDLKTLYEYMTENGLLNKNKDNDYQR